MGLKQGVAIGRLPTLGLVCDSHNPPNLRSDDQTGKLIADSLPDLDVAEWNEEIPRSELCRIQLS
jgi:hypothetical protein